MLFTCTNKCFYKDRLWKVGEKFDWEGAVIPCPDCEGKGCKRCHDTGRINPPHHFIPDEPIDVKAQEKEVKEKTVTIDAETKQIAKLRQEMKSLGAVYDARWGVARLTNELIRVRKAGDNLEPLG